MSALPQPHLEDIPMQERMASLEDRVTTLEERAKVSHEDDGRESQDETRSGTPTESRAQLTTIDLGNDQLRPSGAVPAKSSPPGGNGHPPPNTPAMSDARLNVVTIGLWISLFLAGLESTIVATSVLKIANSFDDFARSGWIVVAYLLTYNGFLLISSKMCDIFGFKAVICAANLVFAVFSILCGCAQSMTQLIIFRAFQGIGGSAIYSVVFIILMKIVPIQKMGAYSGVISSVFAMSSIVGPLVGGAIVDHASWRWVFFLNGPAVAISFPILFFFLPRIEAPDSIRKAVVKIDFLGGFLSIAWSILIVFALESGGVAYPWASGKIIGPLVGGAVALVVFIFYEIWVGKSKVQQPIFPMRLLKNSGLVALIVATLFHGFCFYHVLITLPQRMQVVNNTTASHAGVLLLPLMLPTAFFSFVSGSIFNKWGMKHAYTMLSVGAGMQVIAISCLCTLGNALPIEAKQHVFLAILGVAFGLMISPVLALAKAEVTPRDISVSIGATTMSRTLGGVTGLAVTTAVLHSHLKTKLSAILQPQQLEAFLRNTVAIKSFPQDIATQTRHIYAEASNMQTKIIAAFAAVSFISSLVLLGIGWEWFGPRKDGAGGGWGTDALSEKDRKKLAEQQGQQQKAAGEQQA